MLCVIWLPFCWSFIVLNAALSRKPLLTIGVMWLRPSKSVGTLIQVMPCRLKAPSLYLNVCSLIVTVTPLGTNFSEISIKIHIISFKKVHLKVLSAKWRPSCSGLIVSNAVFTGNWWCCMALGKPNQWAQHSSLAQCHWCWGSTEDTVTYGQVG